VSVEDAEDIVADALLDFVRAGRRGMRLGDGLFLVIVRRRVCDFWRRRRCDVPLGAAVSLACGPDEAALLQRSLEDGLRRVRRTRADRERLVGVTTRILAGDTFAEACKATGIPRGSQNRFRKTLRTLLEAAF
jgi:DNA-directed RNA polymerase specialized sigma24 family protein